MSRPAGAAIVAAIGKFEDASKKVFDFAASFAQPDAIIALSSSVAPAEAAVREALKQFREAAERANAAKSAVIESTTATITWGAAGLAGFLVVALAILAYVIVARSVVLPLRALTGAMRDLAEGNFGMVLPGLGRKDEIGDMAQAVETFKVRAEQKARSDAEAQMKSGSGRCPAAQVRHGQTRRRLRKRGRPDRRDRILFIDAAGSFGRHTDRNRGTYPATHHHGRGRSEEASTNVQSVASATEEMTSSVNEISRQVQDSARMAGAAVGQARHDQRSRQRTVEGGGPHRRRRRTDQHHCGPDQSAGAQRHHRGGARRRGRPGFRRGGLRGQGAG